MCDIGKMFSGGNLGGILGGLAGTGLSILDPALGIPLFLGAGLGSGAGTFLGDVASGKSAGASLLPSLEAGGISGALAGVGNLAAGGDFFGAPASSLSGIFGGAAPTAAATDAASAATTAAAPATQLASTVATPATASTAVGAPAAGGGAAIGDVTTALPTATGGAGASAANLGGSAIGSGGVPLSGPTGALGPSGAAGPTSLIAPSGSEAAAFPAAATGGGAGTGPYGITNPAFTDANINAAWNKAATAGDGGWFSSLFKAQPGGSFLSKGLAGEPGSIAADLTKPSTLITGGAALLPLLQGNAIPGLSAVQNQAKTLNAMGTPLAQALNTGNLPAGAQSSLDAATRAAAAQVRSRYASLGLTGSSQEADALATVDQNAASQKYAELLRTTQQGISEMGMATPILGSIMQTQLAQDQQQQQAIARLAAALAGSTGTEKTTA